MEGQGVHLQCWMLIMMAGRHQGDMYKHIWSYVRDGASQGPLEPFLGSSVMQI